MDAQDAVRILLINDTDVSALVDTRVYSEYAPQSVAFPYIVMQRVTAQHENYFLGSGGLVQPQLQLDLYTKTKADKDDLMEKVRAVIDGFRGNVTIGSETLYLQRCQLVRDLTDLVQPQDGSDRQIWRGSLDFELAHEETVTVFRQGMGAATSTESSGDASGTVTI